MNSIYPFVVILLLTACKTDEKKEAVTEASETPKPSIVEVKTQSMEFFSPDTLKSGWNTFVYENESSEVHFILMDLYPEGKTAADTKTDILPPFEEGMKLIMEGDIDNAIVAFGKLPPWFQEVKYMGGTGIISPKHIATSTIYLEPGLYIMECYVKMADGTWHTSHGMFKEIIVTRESTKMEPPKPTIKIEISSTEGIVVKDTIEGGKQTLEVLFKDQTVYEHFLGHDVNLVKYNDDASLDSLVHWMNWMNPDGLITPSPNGFTFLGGINNLPTLGKGYFEVNLTKGNYMLISEVPLADKKQLIQKFTIN
ncbi:hypothetical protein DZC72_17800 [Maribacter algicola]|uniref:Uncharacterized protein n=1 Tax=Maribacter algicola TaxID=2498892 RepID=A0A426REN6_9FLAO|nr:hypothetical protein [Maribacter algicola]RRQ47447.1 hypothetical protein DZC72_17800 [Maribacter algicola]